MRQRDTDAPSRNRRQAAPAAREARTVLKVGSDFYVLASSLASHRVTRVLADGESFAVFDADGDIIESPLEALGFFHRDTRYLSRCELRVAGETPYFLNSYLSDDNALLRVNLTNPDLGVHSGGVIELRRDAIQIERSWVLADPMIFQRVRVRNFARSLVHLPIEFAFNVDFADLFEVRGIKRLRRGHLAGAQVAADSVKFAYQGLDGVERTTEISFVPRPLVLSASRASFLLDLRPDASTEIEIRACGSAENRASPRKHSRPRGFAKALSERHTRISQLAGEYAKVSASNELFDSLLQRSLADLISLLGSRPEGNFIMGGIPWFATLFGRDSIVTAMSMLPFNPLLAGRTLRTLARLQGTEVNERRDEQPGKIIHEIRSGEMAATGEVPFGRYYGSVDSTPLFLWLYGRLIAETGDLELGRELWPNAKRALQWIEQWGDRDGDGYVEYQRQTRDGLANQGWKDSLDAISHADGSLARTPIALSEVQAYVYAAYVSIAELPARLGDQQTAAELSQRARVLRESFTRDFWLDSDRTVALALDGAKRPCRVMASNAGHCLAAGLLDETQAAALSERLMADDMFSGWGVRTLSARERRYNPMSYHNGSVWPHDNAIAAMGLGRIRGRQGILRILEGLMGAAMQLNTGSLPELFCGFPREQRLGPAPYPVACHPQAWSAASVFMLVQAMLGMRVLGFERRLILDSPTLPPWLEWLRIENLRVGDGATTVTVRRLANAAAAVDITDRRGDVTVEVLK